jgi:hypothetical protein
LGQETRCYVRHSGQRAEGKALLETDEVIFRGELRLKIPLRGVKEAETADGELTLRYVADGAPGEATFELGSPTAERWAKRILNPPSLLDKLGVKTGQRILLAGRFDKDFSKALVDHGADVVQAPRPENDIIFFEANAKDDLAELVPLQQHLKRNGAIWVIRPKGSPAISERDVMDGGKAAGLVDVKVARFSDTHTAEKYVIPVASR